MKSVRSKVAKAPQGAALVVGKASRVAYRYTNATVRDVKKADMRFHAKPAELAQAITASAQATISDVAGTAAAQIGRATTTAAGKTTELIQTTATEVGEAGTAAAGKARALAGTTASDVGNAMGVAAAGVLEHGRVFRKKCQESFEPLKTGARKGGDNTDEWAQAAAAGAWGALVSLQAAVPTFNDLSPLLKTKLALAGMHGAWRPVHLASSFYESSIPFPIRNLGEDAVLAFIDGKHASHIKAVSNMPGRMMDNANIVWEAARDNLARGNADMTPLELAKANTLNALHATGIVAAEALQTAAVAGCIGMALEGVVSVTENLIYVYKDEMTYRQAGRRVLKDMLTKGKGAAIGGAGMTVVVALGGGPALATAAPVLVTVGGIVYVVTAYSRIKTAADSAIAQPDDLPLDLSPPGMRTGLSSAG
ncbi:MAG: hypothetical protein OXM57_08545 [bacterium]|nr:hypothetical protein [bacterium]MDE0352727.1 hypothetical protein [bacterium]